MYMSLKHHSFFLHVLFILQEDQNKLFYTRIIGSPAADDHTLYRPMATGKTKFYSKYR